MKYFISFFLVFGLSACSDSKSSSEKLTSQNQEEKINKEKMTAKRKPAAASGEFVCFRNYSALSDKNLPLQEVVQYACDPSRHFSVTPVGTVYNSYMVCCIKK